MMWCCSVGEGVSPIEAKYRSFVLAVPSTYALEIWTNAEDITSGYSLLVLTALRDNDITRDTVRKQRRSQNDVRRGTGTRISF